MTNMEDLVQQFGFRPPDAFRSFMSILDEFGQMEGQFPGNLFLSLTDFVFHPADMRHWSFPSEFLPFAHEFCASGARCGYVSHTPDEMPAEDWLVGQCRISNDGERKVTLFGLNTYEAIETMLSRKLLVDENSEGFSRRQIAALSSLLDITPMPEKAMRPYNMDGTLQSIDPDVPTGWRYVPSSDGIGVLAPRSAFAPSAGMWSRDAKADDYETMARSFMQKGYPATALWFAREGLWRFWADGPYIVIAFSHLIRIAYTKLDRPTLAEIESRRILEFEENVRRWENETEGEDDMV